MDHAQTRHKDDVEDIYFGQVICIWARWFVVASSAILVLWSEGDSAELAKRILLVVGLIAVNFYMQGRSLMDRPANQRLVALASSIDVVAIFLVVGGFGSGAGLANPYFVLLMPVLFAFALVMQPRSTAIFCLIVLTAYSAIAIVAHPKIVTNAADAKTLIERLIALAAVGALGALYWRIQRDRRREGQHMANASPGRLQHDRLNPEVSAPV